MADDTPSDPQDEDAGSEDGADEGTDPSNQPRESTHGGVEPATARQTAPQSPFSARQAGIGVVVLAVGLLVTFAIPFLLA